MVRRAHSKQPLPRYAMTGQTGSWLYMAPEVMLNKPYNEKVDIFSLGIILYEVRAGCRVWPPSCAPA